MILARKISYLSFKSLSLPSVFFLLVTFTLVVTPDILLLLCTVGNSYDATLIHLMCLPGPVEATKTLDRSQRKPSILATLSLIVPENMLFYACIMTNVVLCQVYLQTGCLSKF
jgi:hypothetical protein